MFIYCDECMLVTKHRILPTVFQGKNTETYSECMTCGSMYYYEYDIIQELLKEKKEILKEIKK